MGSKCKFVFPCLARCSCFFTWCMVTLDWHRFLWQIKYRSNKKLSGKREVDKLGGHVTLNTCSWKNKKFKSMLSFTAKSYFQRSNSLKTTNKFSRWFYYYCYKCISYRNDADIKQCIWRMSNEINNFSVTWKRS